MCYNCGCGEPENDMGKPKMVGASLIDASFEEMAKEWGMSIEEVKLNVFNELKKQLIKD